MNFKQLESQVLSCVDSKLLMKHVEFISSFDRESGSIGEKRATEYFDKTMKEYGLEAEVKYIENLISLPVSAEITLDNGKKLECITHSYAASTSKEGISANAVFYPNTLDVNGKIAIINGLASPAICYNLERLGAIGVICISGCEYPYNMAISPIWGMPVPSTVDLLGTIPVVTVNNINGDNLLNYINDEQNIVNIVAEVDTKFRQVPLCIADLKVNKDTDRYILFNGHVDAWHKGATDNGTSNAAILEIARILKSFEDHLNVNIRFVWWSGHSNGRYSGSNWYADYNWQDIHENAIVNVNIDAIGAKGATSYRHIESSAQCYKLGFDVIKNLTSQEPKYARIQRNGDQSFWGHGVPSLFEILSLQPESTQGKSTFVPGLPWYWHTVKDEFEQVGEEELKQDTMIYLSSILAFAAKPVFPFSYENLGSEMLSNIDDCQAIAKESFDLSLIKNQIIRMKDLFIELDNEIARVNNMDNLSNNDLCYALLLNNYLMELNRIVIPVHYCKSTPFEVDLALPVKPFPGLTDLEKLSQLNKDSFKFKILERQLIREKNRIYHSFNDAIKLLTDIKSKR